MLKELHSLRLSTRYVTIKAGLQMDLFAIIAKVAGAVLFVASGYIIVFNGVEVTFKGKTGAGIVSIVIAYVIWSIRELFVYLRFVAVMYVVLGIILILYEPIPQWHTIKRREIEEIIQLNKEAIRALLLALFGVICLMVSTKV